MATLNISAGQIRVGDILNGREVLDFEIRGNLINICMVNPETDLVMVRGYDRETDITVETDYLIRDEDSADGENWEDAIDNDIAEMNSQDADNIVESVGDLLDY